MSIELRHSRPETDLSKVPAFRRHLLINHGDQAAGLKLKVLAGGPAQKA